MSITTRTNSSPCIKSSAAWPCWANFTVCPIFFEHPADQALIHIVVFREKNPECNKISGGQRIFLAGRSGRGRAPKFPQGVEDGILSDRLHEPHDPFGRTRRLLKEVAIGLNNNSRQLLASNLAQLLDQRFRLETIRGRHQDHCVEEIRVTRKHEARGFGTTG
jgi:hypothetical protein